MFLDAHDLILLTGYKQPARQILQLRAMRIPHYINARGYPMVTEGDVAGIKKARRSGPTLVPHHQMLSGSCG